MIYRVHTEIRQSLGVCPTNAGGTANSVDPDQITPSRAVLTCLGVPDCLVPHTQEQSDLGLHFFARGHYGTQIHVHHVKTLNLFKKKKNVKIKIVKK